MRGPNKLTRSERREIEAALTTEIERTGDVRHYALTEALRRLDAGTYGACAYCGNSIPTGRLLVIPETDHCLGCGSVS